MKNNTKRKAAWLLVMALVIGMLPMTTFGADYDTHWAKEAIVKWKNSGLIKGYEDDTFRPKQAVTKAELAAFIVRVKGLTNTKGAKDYIDIKKDAWYADSVIKVSSAKLMHIEGDQFAPDKAATREEAAYAIATAYSITGTGKHLFDDDYQISDWAKDKVSALYEKGFISGRPNNLFAPKDTLTRADLIVMLDKITGAVINEAGTYTSDIEGNLVVNSANVTLKDLTIKGNLYLTEGIGEGDVTLDGVTVEGTTYVEGGGKNSIHVSNSALINVIINKQTGVVRIVAEGNSVVQQVEIQSSAILLENKLTGNGFKDVLLASDLPSNSKVELTGSFETVEVLAHSIQLDIPSGSVDLLSILEGAGGLGVILGSNTTVRNATINATTAFTGQGTIINATANSEGIVFDSPVTNLTTTEGITAPTGNGMPSSTTNSSNNTTVDDDDNNAPSGDDNNTPSGDDNNAPSGDNNNTPSGDDNNTPSDDDNESTVANFSFVLGPNANGVVLDFTTNSEIQYSTENTTSSNIVVNATIGDQVFAWESSYYDIEDKKLYLESENLFSEANLGKQFTIEVTGKNEIVGTYATSITLNGFAGRIYDVHEQGVAGVKISFREGIGNTSGEVVAVATTDKNGYYGVFLRPGSYTGTMYKPGYMSSNRIIATSADNYFNKDESAVFIEVPLVGEMRTVLTWGERPTDLDSHLIAKLDNKEIYHTWYADKVADKNDGTGIYAELDWDDVTSYGPETTTIRDLKPGKYEYYVHNFSRYPDITTSQAKVEVYYSEAEPIESFTMPSNPQDKLYWHVYDMTVSEDGTYAITSVNELVDTLMESNPAYDANVIDKIYTATTTSGGYTVDLSKDWSSSKVDFGYSYQEHVKVTTQGCLAIKLKQDNVIAADIVVNHHQSPYEVGPFGIYYFEPYTVIDKDEEYLYIPLGDEEYQVFEIIIDEQISYLYIVNWSEYGITSYSHEDALKETMHKYMK